MHSHSVEKGFLFDANVHDVLLRANVKMMTGNVD